VTPSPQQDTALQRVKRWLEAPRKPFFYLAGYAGTGKTTLARHFAEGVGGQVLYAAYTGKAASVMRSKGCVGATTLHSLAYIPKIKCRERLRQLVDQLEAAAKAADHQLVDHLESQIAEENKQLARPAFSLNQESALKSASLLIVDECSMASDRIGEDLVSFGVPILALGDPAQLPPVQGEGYFTQGDPDFLLTEIHRQALDNPIIRLSMAVRQGRGRVEDDLPYGDYGDSRVVREVDGSTAMAHDQMIVGRNDTRRQYNEKMRRLLGRRSLVETGDRVVCLRNNHDLGLMNGAVFAVVEVREDEEGPVLLIDDGESRAEVPIHVDTMRRGSVPDGASFFERQGREEFCHAYALTCHKCVSPDTLVETPEGLREIGSLASTGVVGTHEKPQEYVRRFDYAESPLLRVVTESGYSIRMTPNHRAETVRDGQHVLVDASDLCAGDWVRMRLSPSVDAVSCATTPERPIVDVRSTQYQLPSECEENLSEFLGLMVADGTLYRTGFRLVKRHETVRERFRELCVLLFGAHPRPISVLGTPGYEVSSRFLVEWLKAFDCLKPRKKNVPTAVLQSPLSSHAAFLRGLFEDGAVNVKKSGAFDHIELSQKHPGVLATVQRMLLRFGIISSLHEDRGTLYIYSQSAARFRDAIGFIEPSKQSRLSSIPSVERRRRIPLLDGWEVGLSVSQRQNALAVGYVSRHVGGDKSREWHYERIVKIENDAGPSVCLEVPEGHRFLQNGFPFGNSQGSQWPAVMVLDESAVFQQNQRRWLYTAISRGSERVTILRR